MSPLFTKTNMWVCVCVCVLVSLTPAGWWDRVAAGQRWSRTSRVGRWCWLRRKAVCSGSRSAEQRLVRWSDWLCHTPAAETPPARGTGEPRPASNRHRPQPVRTQTHLRWPIRTQTHLRQPITTQILHKWPIRTQMLHKWPIRTWIHLRWPIRTRTETKDYFDNQLIGLLFLWIIN